MLPGVCERWDNLQNSSHQDAARICTNIQQADEYVRTHAVTKQDLHSFAVHIGKLAFPSTSADAHSDFLVLPENNGVGDNIIPDSGTTPKAYTLQHHKCITSIWNKWFGCIDGLERANREWRGHFSAADAKQFYRMKKVVDSVAEAIEQSGTNDVSHF